MYCSQLIWRSGGSNSIHGETVEECKQNVARRSTANHICATVPYEIFKSSKGVNLYDATIPEDVRQGLGEDLMKLYLQAD